MDPKTEGHEKRAAREQAVDWLLRLEDGDLPAADRRAFEQWRGASPLNDAAFREASRLLQMSGKALAEKPQETKMALGKKRRRSTAPLAILTVGIGAGVFWAADGPTRLYADAMTGVSETRTIVLEDGGRIRLNASSAIAKDFSQGRRGVRLLRGEAYFEVAKDASRPFVVEVGEGHIRVLGTAFNVNMTSYDTEVTVTESRVELSISDDSEVLESGQRASFKPAGTLGDVETVSPDRAAPWLSGRLVFEEQPLESVVEQLARRIPGSVIVVGEAVKRRRISGSFDMSDPHAALDSFASAFGLSAVRMGPVATLLY